jgi:large subunit ribosomal protein L1
MAKKLGKRYSASLQTFDRHEVYDVKEAMELVIKTATAKFDETIEAHIRFRRSGSNSF